MRGLFVHTRVSGTREYTSCTAEIDICDSCKSQLTDEVFLLYVNGDICYKWGWFDRFVIYYVNVHSTTLAGRSVSARMLLLFVILAVDKKNLILMILFKQQQQQQYCNMCQFGRNLPFLVIWC